VELSFILAHSLGVCSRIGECCQLYNLYEFKYIEIRGKMLPFTHPQLVGVDNREELSTMCVTSAQESRIGAELSA
jgi:hypothetical protein